MMFGLKKGKISRKEELYRYTVLLKAIINRHYDEEVILYEEDARQWYNKKEKRFLTLDELEYLVLDITRPDESSQDDDDYYSSDFMDCGCCACCGCTCYENEYDNDESDTDENSDG